jgi:hypothetical protein
LGVSIFIITVSLALFVYWFRYTCLLILSAKTGRDYAAQVAAANQLTFIQTRNALNENPNTPLLDQFHHSLDRDYTLLKYLLRNAANHYGSGRSVENAILMLDFRIMSSWYFAVRRLSATRARNALLEMSLIVNHLANSMGERLALSAGA